MKMALYTTCICIRRSLHRWLYFVGDPDRVAKVSAHFDKIDTIRQKREFVTHTGYIGSRHISVISTGIGTDNIDIVMNELDALVNIDFATRLPKPVRQSLQFIRLGTSGAIRADIPVGSILVSEMAIGLDGLAYYYNRPETAMENTWLQHLEQYLQWPEKLAKPYMTSRSLALKQHNFIPGITITCQGFYAPQGRNPGNFSAFPDLIDRLAALPGLNNLHTTNLEMETAGIYAMAAVMGHQAVSVSAILANRASQILTRIPKLRKPICLKPYLRD